MKESVRLHPVMQSEKLNCRNCETTNSSYKQIAKREREGNKEKHEDRMEGLWNITENSKYKQEIGYFYDIKKVLIIFRGNIHIVVMFLNSSSFKNTC